MERGFTLNWLVLIHRFLLFEPSDMYSPGERSPATLNRHGPCSCCCCCCCWFAAGSLLMRCYAAAAIASGISSADLMTKQQPVDFLTCVFLPRGLRRNRQAHQGLSCQRRKVERKPTKQNNRDGDWSLEQACPCWFSRLRQKKTRSANCKTKVGH